MSLAALILAGGGSRRMGVDKLRLPRIGATAELQGARHRTVLPAGGDARGRLPVTGKETGTQTENSVLYHVIQVAAQVADAVYIASPPVDGNGWLQDLQEVGHGEGSAGARVVVQRDRDWHRGPLQALHDAWRDLSQYDFIAVLAGDLPGLSLRVLEVCLQRLRTVDDSYDGVAVVRNGQWQPLLGCYRSAAGRAWKCVEEGEERVLRAFSNLRMGAIDARLQGWPMWWTKPIHTPADYAAWLEWQISHDEIPYDEGGDEGETRGPR